MTHIGYLAAGWSITLFGISVYAYLVVRKGKILSRQVRPDRQRWMQSGKDS